MADPRKGIDTLQSRIENVERGGDSETDRELLLAFSDRLDLLREECGNYRHLKLLRHCTRLAAHAGNLDAALQGRDASEDIVRWIHREYDNEETNRDYRVALRVFARRVAGDIERYCRPSKAPQYT